MDYQKAYEALFNAIPNALTELDRASDKSPEIIRAEMILKNAQQQTEIMYMEAE